MTVGSAGSTLCLYDALLSPAVHMLTLESRFTHTGRIVKTTKLLKVFSSLKAELHMLHGAAAAPSEGTSAVSMATHTVFLPQSQKFPKKTRSSVGQTDRHVGMLAGLGANGRHTCTNTYTGMSSHTCALVDT